MTVPNQRPIRASAELSDHALEVLAKSDLIPDENGRTDNPGRIRRMEMIKKSRLLAKQLGQFK